MSNTPAPLRFLTRRQNAATSAFLVFPLFLTYQLGIVLGLPGRNGVDLTTDFLIRLCNADRARYLLLLAVLAAGYAALVAGLRRRRAPEWRAALPALGESTVYAFFMGTLILFVMHSFLDLVPGLFVGDLGRVIVVSAGAGFHEELIFRAGLMGGGARLLGALGGNRRGWIAALVFSSLAFAGIHHWGPGAEPFSLAAFTYRSLAGVYFALIYHFRGFATAAWTHALYDVYVLGWIQ